MKSTEERGFIRNRNNLKKPHESIYPSFIKLGELKQRKKLEKRVNSMVKPRAPQTTVKFVDTYCELYRQLFTDVRAYDTKSNLINPQKTL